ncbi:MAG TPA: hypothetical protein VJW95_05170 [Dissulfurispiraceae bacterium]|nr:hypothetical protein [Dissulfurispiraceae bacterium]
MLVKIMYQNDTLAEVEPSSIDELISSAKIKKILRSDGWVSVATAALRGRILGHEGPERRRVPVEVMSQRSQCNLREAASERTHTDSETMHDHLVVSNEVSIPRMSGQMDIDEFYCPECGGKCEEKEILSGSNVGMTLLMKCTNDVCYTYFIVTCDSRGWVESVDTYAVRNAREQTIQPNDANVSSQPCRQLQGVLR